MQDLDGIAPGWFLGPDGPIAQSFDDFEHRPQQVEMANAITDALSSSNHLMVEAGTGVGKSFAYLLPAIAHALQRKEKVVISTYTIALQEQLLRKDIPFIKEVLDQDFTAILAKGRSNYLCMKRLQQAQKKQLSLFDTPDHLNMLEDLFHWGLQTQDGSLSDLPMSPPHQVWEMVCSDDSSCQGKVCNRQSDCFYQRSRRKLYNADLIIVNHALLFSDLAIRAQGGSILPPYKHVIFDEAHNMETVASKHFGLRLSNSQVDFMLNRIYNPKTQKGILAGKKDDILLKLIGEIHQSSNNFFEQLQFYANREQEKNTNGRVLEPHSFHNSLSYPLKKLSDHIALIAENENDPQEKLEISGLAQRAYAFADAIDAFINQELDDSVYWIEHRRRRTFPFTALCASPIHVGPVLKKSLFDSMDSVILTSATLSTDGKKEKTENLSLSNGFSFFSNRLGLENFLSLQLGSPFDYTQQVKMYVESYLPEPNNKKEFLVQSVDAIKKYIQQTHGKALLLFTSFDQLFKTADELSDFCMMHDIKMLVQGKSENRIRLLDEFKQNSNSILLGTDSFWQGIDVPGESLSNVIIVKLPFAVPDEPLLQARLEKIEQQGGSAFFDYQLPEAVIKFKQGFGRLIRSKTDEGIIVILDPRIKTKRYGHFFLKALPSCPTEVIMEP